MVNSGATLRMGGGYIRRTGTCGSTWFQTFTLDGTLVYYGTNVRQIGAATINLNGTVEYSASGSQILETNYSPGGSAEPSTYTNLRLSGSGTKTLSMNTTVNGTLTLGRDLDTTAGYVLTLGSGASVAGAGDVVGTVRRASPATGTALQLNNLYTTINFATAPTQMDVKLTKSAPSGLTRAVTR